jgi:hypothetical protein
MNTKSVAELHAEHGEWLNKLEFYVDEISIQRIRLSEIASKNTSKEILAQVEHFQNQFIVQKENIDELRHAIKDHEIYVENRVTENPVDSDHRQLHDHPKMRENFDGFEKNFNSLRHEFNAFLSKNM